MRNWIRAAGVVIGATLAIGTTSATAVIGGERDNGRSPNVGMILGTDAIGPLLVCTGTLVNPTTVVTAAHCVQPEIDGYGAVTYEVTFDDQVAVANGFPLPLPLGSGISGTPVPNATFDNAILSSAGVGTSVFTANGAQDIGVLVLDAPVTGITPAQIVPAGAMDGAKKVDFLQVGYGDTREGPPGQPGSYVMDGFRNRSMFPLRHVRTDLLYGNANPNNANGFGMPASGDSGSPWFLDGKLAGVFAFGGNNNTVAAVRVDAGVGRAFLAARGVVGP